VSSPYALPAGRRAKFIVALVFFAVTLGVGGAFAGEFEDAQENDTASFLPGDKESVRALRAVEQYPGGELAPAVTVYSARAACGPPTASGSPPTARSSTAPASLPPCRRASRSSPPTARPRC